MGITENGETEEDKDDRAYKKFRKSLMKLIQKTDIKYWYIQETKLNWFLWEVNEFRGGFRKIGNIGVIGKVGKRDNMYEHQGQ